MAPDRAVDPVVLGEMVERVERASGPDRELDGAIWWAFSRRAAEREYWRAALGMSRRLPDDFKPSGLGWVAVYSAAPAYTASVDAAIKFGVQLGARPIYTLIGCIKQGPDATVDQLARTGVSACLRASLRAVQAQQVNND